MTAIYQNRAKYAQRIKSVSSRFEPQNNMKKLQKINSLIRGAAVGLAVVGCIGTAKAIPFASGATNITIGGSNYVTFIMNEAGATVSAVTYPSGSSNVITTNCLLGRTNFYLGTDTSYQIYAYKSGNGTPIQITVDALATTNYTTGATNWLIGNLWPTPRGVDINKDPKFGSRFGRIYIANGGIGNTSSTTSGVTESGATIPGTITNFRGQGLYALNADSSDALGYGTNAAFAGGNGAGFYWTSTSTSSPYKVSVNPQDDTVDIADYSTANASVFKFDPDFVTNNAVYGTNILMLYPAGETLGNSLGYHGDITGVFTTGSIATSNLEIWTFDPELGAPSTNCVLGIGNEGQTVAGNFNQMYRYDIGAGPLPWHHGPNQGVNAGLPGFQDSQTGSVSLGPDMGSNFVYVQFYRANLSDPCVQVFTNVPTTTNIIGTNVVVTPGQYNLVYSSMVNSQGQEVLTGGTADVMESAYAQLRVSPDGQYLASIGIDNNIWVASLTNGIPDNSSIIEIGGLTTGNARGLAFDAADNIYFCSSGLGLMRGYSLGFTATTVYANDITGTNGTFQLVSPPVTATVVATQNGSQNYINSSPSGTPIPGIFTISLTTNSNAAPVAVNITLAGTATNGVNYTLNSADANGVTYSSTQVVFPAGTNAGGTNWVAHLLVTPTASPLTGPSFTVTLAMVGGTNYAAGSPHTAVLSIANTGPQYLFLSAASAIQGPTMNRGIPGDYARFVLTRWGDTNGPGNSTLVTNQVTYTVTNITYGGTANFTNDYGAQAQRLDPTGNGVSQIPVAGSPGIVIYPGNVTINCDVGLPVFHTNSIVRGTNLTVTVNLETAVPAGGTNGTSMEGYPYEVGTATETLTEIDNAQLLEVVIWNDPLTNSVDPGWTLTYASTNMNYGGTTPAYTNPVVVANYTNTETALYGMGGGTNDFQADFGYTIGNEHSTTFGELPNVPQSPVMANNGWTNALRMTVNKNGNFAPAAVNLFPTNQNFYGNIGLRFEMFLSTYYYAQGNPYAGTIGREFGLFGMNSYGTNCNWRPTVAVNNGTGGSGPTNTDGAWVGIDAGSGSLTPADFDAFNSPTLPNSANVSVAPTTYDSDVVSSPSTGDTGIFKNPPFVLDENLTGGNPANLWVEVSLEKTQMSTNFNAFWMNLFLEHNYVNAALPINTWTTTTGALNGMVAGNYTNGTIMLGYEDPVGDVSDSSAFVYFSNVRVVELAPFISAPPTNMLVLKNAVVTNSATAIYSYGGNITNVWYRGTTTPATVVATHTDADTNFTDTLVINTATGSNYWCVFTDSSGGFTTSSVAAVEVVTPPANVSAGVGGTATFSVSGTGPTALATYQWQTNGVNLASSAKYKVINAASLTNSSVVLADNGTVYSCTVTATATNQYYVPFTETLTTSGATLTVETAPSGAVVTPASQTNEWGSSASFTVTVGAGSPTLTYAWEKNGTKLGSTSKYSGTNTATLVISNLTQADDSTNYSVIVTNLSGGTTSTMGSLVVYVPQPTFTGASPGGTTFAFTSTNVYDKSNSFTLLSSPTAIGPYTNAVGATFSGSAGSFSVTIPQPNSSNMFYQLLHVN